MADDDRELLDRWRSGDRAAGSQLFRKHFHSVTRFFRARVAEDSVDDLVQSTFERCVSSGDRIRDGLRLRAYLLAIARNELLMHLRSKQVRARSLPIEVDEATRASWLANYNAEQRLLLQGLRSLADEHAIIIELRYWEELSYLEIAAVLGIPINTVKTRLHRARARLAAEIEQLEAEPEVLEMTLSKIEHWVASIRERVIVPPTD